MHAWLTSVAVQMFNLSVSTHLGWQSIFVGHGLEALSISCRGSCKRTTNGVRSSHGLEAKLGTDQDYFRDDLSSSRAQAGFLDDVIV